MRGKPDISSYPAEPARTEGLVPRHAGGTAHGTPTPSRPCHKGWEHVPQPPSQCQGSASRTARSQWEDNVMRGNPCSNQASQQGQMRQSLKSTPATGHQPRSQTVGPKTRSFTQEKWPPPHPRGLRALSGHHKALRAFRRSPGSSPAPQS